MALSRPKDGFDSRTRCPFSSPIQIWPEPFLDVLNADALSLRVVTRLIVADFPDPEIFGIGVRKVKAAHAGAGMHRQRFRKRDASLVFRVEQIEKGSLLRVIRRRGVTGGRTDAAIFFANQFVR